MGEFTFMATSSPRTGAADAIAKLNSPSTKPCACATVYKDTIYYLSFYLHVVSDIKFNVNWPVISTVDVK
jgi:hypothetical protein